MHLAILMTNTDESAFAQAHPKDGEKFTRLIQMARPDWTTEVFAVKDGQFPDDISRFDGAIITGSPASVNSGDAWVIRLFELIRHMHECRLPIFGACFGHQAIAMALGGNVGDNPNGKMVHGLIENQVVERPDWANDLPEKVYLYASHKEQVIALPERARVTALSYGCDVAGYAIDDNIYTTQHHPEMTAEFFAALTEEIGDELGEDIAQNAIGSMNRTSDMAVFAESVARFFEQANDRAGPVTPAQPINP